MTNDQNKDAIRAEMAAATAQVLRLAMTDMLTALQLLARIERITEADDADPQTQRGLENLKRKLADIVDELSAGGESNRIDAMTPQRLTKDNNPPQRVCVWLWHGQRKRWSVQQWEISHMIGLNTDTLEYTHWCLPAPPPPVN